MSGWETVTPSHSRQNSREDFTFDDFLNNQTPGTVQVPTRLQFQNHASSGASAMSGGMSVAGASTTGTVGISIDTSTSEGRALLSFLVQGSLITTKSGMYFHRNQDTLHAKKMFLDKSKVKPLITQFSMLRPSEQSVAEGPIDRKQQLQRGIDGVKLLANSVLGYVDDQMADLENKKSAATEAIRMAEDVQLLHTLLDHFQDKSTDEHKVYPKECLTTELMTTTFEALVGPGKKIASKAIVNWDTVGNMYSLTDQRIETMDVTVTDTVLSALVEVEVVGSHGAMFEHLQELKQQGFLAPNFPITSLSTHDRAPPPAKKNLVKLVSNKPAFLRSMRPGCHFSMARVDSSKGISFTDDGWYPVPVPEPSPGPKPSSPSLVDIANAVQGTALAKGSKTFLEVVAYPQFTTQAFQDGFQNMGAQDKPKTLEQFEPWFNTSYTHYFINKIKAECDKHDLGADWKALSEEQKLACLKDVLDPKLQEHKKAGEEMVRQSNSNADANNMQMDSP